MMYDTKIACLRSRIIGLWNALKEAQWKPADDELIYLAVPYTHADPMVRAHRASIVSVAAAKLMKAGHNVFSPISMGVKIAEAGDVPTTWEYWERFNRRMMRCCTMLYVVTVHGWKESKGVQAEIKYAHELGLPMRLLYPEEL